METFSNRMKGRTGYSSVILMFAGAFAVIQGLLAVYEPRLFAAGATFWFSDLDTWGWIIFGLGVASILAGAAVATGAEAARWFGVLVAGLFGLGQLLFAEAYPLWSLVMVGTSLVAVHGLFTHGGEARTASALGSTHETAETEQDQRPADVTDVRARRAA